MVETMREVNTAISAIDSYYESKDKEHERSHVKDILFLGFALPFDTPHNQSIELRKSVAVHGRGLFAKKAIPSEVIVTFHPAHLLLSPDNYLYDMCHKSDTSEKTKQTKKAKKKQNKEDEEIAQIRLSLLMHYSIAMNGDNKSEEENGYRLVGNPIFDQDKRVLGHFVNDASYNVFKGVPVESLRDWCVFYGRYNMHILGTLGHENCYFKEDKHSTVVAVVTLREIAPNEELRACYPLDHWLMVEYGATFPKLYPYLAEHWARLLDFLAVAT